MNLWVSQMVGVRQFDEQEVIAQALDVFRRKGLSEATMQDLAAATGVQRGSLYNAYGDKEAIFVRAYDQYAREFFEIAAKALSGAKAAEEDPNIAAAMAASAGMSATSTVADRLAALRQRQ